MTLDEAAARTGRRVELLRRWARDERIPASKVGRDWFIAEADLAAIEAMPTKPWKRAAKLTFRFDADSRRFELANAGATFRFPVLDGLALREWHRDYADVSLAFLDELERAMQPSSNSIKARLQSLQDVMAAGQRAEDRLVEALVAYDITGGLSREWIENNLTPEQLVLVARRIVVAHG